MLQTAETHPQLKKIYVASLGGKQGAAELRDKLILRLKKSPPLKLSEALPRTRSSRNGRDLADRIYQYQPETFSYSRQPIYDGYLSVELRGKGGAVLWSYVAKPGKF